MPATQRFSRARPVTARQANGPCSAGRCSSLACPVRERRWSSRSWRATRIHGAGELTLVRRSFESIPALLGRSEPPIDCLAQLDATASDRLAAQHRSWLDACDEGQADLIVDKMPDNYLYVGLIAAMFPDAVLVHCRRDLRDVAVSCWMTNFRSIRWASDLDHLASRFAQHRRVMEHWRTALPGAIHEVNYEETVHDLEGVARRLIAACGLEWEPRCLEFHRLRGRSARPAWRKCGSRSTRNPLLAGKTTRPRWPSFSRVCRRRQDLPRPAPKAPCQNSAPNNFRRRPDGLEASQIRPTGVSPATAATGAAPGAGRVQRQFARRPAQRHFASHRQRRRQQYDQSGSRALTRWTTPAKSRSTSQPTSDKALTIVGQSRTNTFLTADFSAQSRILEIDGNDQLTVKLEQLTIEGGRAVSNDPTVEARGGGLLVDGGNVTLSNVAAFSNQAVGASGAAGLPGASGQNGGHGGNGGAAAGGGIYLASGSLTLINANISGNTAPGARAAPAATAATNSRPTRSRRANTAPTIPTTAPTAIRRRRSRPRSGWARRFGGFRVVCRALRLLR